MLLIDMSLQKLPLCINSLCCGQIAWDLKVSVQIWRTPWYLCAHLLHNAAHPGNNFSLNRCNSSPKPASLSPSPWRQSPRLPLFLGGGFLLNQEEALSSSLSLIPCSPLVQLPGWRKAESCCAVMWRNKTGIQALSRDLSGNAAGSTWQPHECDNPSLGSRSSVGMW